MQQQMSIDEVKLIYNTFDRDFESLVLSTVSSEGFPHVSYAPYIKIMNEYYVIVSEKAEHYSNLNQNKKASLMFIQDELSTGNVFFRNRLTFKCNVEEVNDETVNQLFIDKHGELVDMLLYKMDFHIFKLTPFIGKIVLGPGRAFLIKDDEFVLDTGAKGHMKE